MKKFFNEFKDFATRGNAIELAIGVIIGGAFTSIVNSLVADIIMPLINVVTGTMNFTTLKWVIRPNSSNPVNLTYGNFIQAGINFLLTTLVIFIAIKGLNNLFKAKETQKEEPTEPVIPADVALLEEILVELKKTNKK